MSLMRSRVNIGWPHAARVGSWLQRRAIRSIQSGTIALTSVTSNTATINAVVTANSILLVLSANSNNADGANCCVRVDLTNTTTITATRVGNSATTATVGFVVLEFEPGLIRSIQRGTIAFSASSSTGAITSVNTARAHVTALGMSTADAVGTMAEDEARVTLTNATTVTATKGGAGSACTVGFQVVEWW